MAYVEGEYHYEDWEVDNGSGKLDYDITIVNDFFAIPTNMYNEKTKSFIADFEPLHYWVVDPDAGCQLSDTYDTYEECVQWIKDNYLNSYKITNVE